jgi:5-methylcytosine-specific restriction endonuclease McrA
METANLYNTLHWRTVAARARKRDGGRCTVSRLLGGECSGRLHVHHIVAVSEGGARFDLENLGTVCASHHPFWESLRRVLVRRLTAPAPRCGHWHASAEARRICEQRLARQRGAAVA